MNQMKLLNHDPVGEIKKEIAYMQMVTRVADVVFQALKAMEGKAINKRIETAVCTALPNHVVHFENDWMPTIKVWGCGLEYNRPLRVTLGTFKKEDPKVFSFAKMGEYGANQYLAEYPAKVKELEALIPKLPKLIEQFEAAKKAYDAAEQAFGYGTHVVFR